jgi:hypothetical protein
MDCRTPRTRRNSDVWWTRTAATVARSGVARAPAGGSRPATDDLTRTARDSDRAGTAIRRQRRREGRDIQHVGRVAIEPARREYDPGSLVHRVAFRACVDAVPPDLVERAPVEVIVHGPPRVRQELERVRGEVAAAVGRPRGHGREVRPVQHVHHRPSHRSRAEAGGSGPAHHISGAKLDWKTKVTLPRRLGREKRPMWSPGGTRPSGGSSLGDRRRGRVGVVVDERGRSRRPRASEHASTEYAATVSIGTPVNTGSFPSRRNRRYDAGAC